MTCEGQNLQATKVGRKINLRNKKEHQDNRRTFSYTKL